LTVVKDHEGRITTDRPDEMWGTDQTGTMTAEGHAFIFIAVDHCTAECLGIHATRRGNRFEALEPIRQGGRRVFGAYDAEIAVGLKLRHDHGSQFISRHYQDELRFLGIEPSPAFVREPEGNGVAERFIRTLKEQLLWVRYFATIGELRLALLGFMDKYNRQWAAGEARRSHAGSSPRRLEAEVAA
jgi:transposase InsO family protein